MPRSATDAKTTSMRPKDRDRLTMQVFESKTETRTAISALETSLEAKTLVSRPHPW